MWQHHTCIQYTHIWWCDNTIHAYNTHTYFDVTTPYMHTIHTHILMWQHHTCIQYTHIFWCDNTIHAYNTHIECMKRKYIQYCWPLNYWCTRVHSTVMYITCVHYMCTLDVYITCVHYMCVFPKLHSTIQCMGKPVPHCTVLYSAGENLSPTVQYGRKPVPHYTALYSAGENLSPTRQHFTVQGKTCLPLHSTLQCRGKPVPNCTVLHSAGVNLSPTAQYYTKEGTTQCRGKHVPTAQYYTVQG